MSQPTLQTPSPHNHGRLVRLSSVSLASVLALLVGTSILPPIVSDQSDRAVVNAPISLLTAPIAGDLGAVSVKAGDRVERGQLLAQVGNDRLDRSTAIQVAGRVSELRERALAAENKRTSNEAYIAALDRTIREQTAQTTLVFRAQAEELKAKIASAFAAGEEKKVLMDRQVGMVSRNVASPDMVKSTTQSYAAALHEKEAAVAKLSQKTTQLDGLSKGLYVGDELANLAELAQKRLALTYDTQRLSIEEKELKAAMADQQSLLTRENGRLDRLAKAEVRASSGGVVYNVSSTAGRHVSAGDSLASVVNCDHSFVVAIFSYRQGQNLQVGSPVTISGERGGPRKGVVTEILPKTSDTVDATYAVPFPQTERRELYVLVKPEPVKAVEAASDDEQAKAACGVGRWVTVSRDAGWVPSNSVVWRDLAAATGGLIAKVTASAVGLFRETAEAGEGVKRDPAEVTSSLETGRKALGEALRAAPLVSSGVPILASLPPERLEVLRGIDFRLTARPAQEARR